MIAIDVRSQLKRYEVSRIALEWLNTPYHPHARVKHVGCDCLTFIVCVYEETGLIEHIEIPYYSPQWHLHHSKEMYLEGVLKYCNEKEKPDVGDVVLFKVGRTFSHAAIVLKWPLVIHAHMNRGVIMTDATNDGLMVGRKIKFFEPRALTE